MAFGFTSCEKDTQKPSAPGTEDPGGNPGGEVDPKPECRLLEDFENGGMLTWTGSVPQNRGRRRDAIEIPSAMTKSGAWETLAFDYEPKTPADGAYRNFVILSDAGAVTTKGEEYFYGNIRLCKE